MPSDPPVELWEAAKVFTAIVAHERRTGEFDARAYTEAAAALNRAAVGWVEGSSARR